MECNSHLGLSNVYVNETPGFIAPEITFSSDTICSKVYSFFAELGDNTELLCQKHKLRPDFKDLHASCRASVMYEYIATMSAEQCTHYSNDVKCLDKRNGTLHCLALITKFPTPSWFKRYFHKVKRLGVVEQCWVHAVINYHNVLLIALAALRLLRSSCRTSLVRTLYDMK